MHRMLVRRNIPWQGKPRLDLPPRSEGEGQPMHRRPAARLAACCPIRVALITSFMAGLAFAGVASADKSDIILFKNGDRLTGELKTLDRGKISFDTSATGVIKIEWDDIEQLYSSTTFEVAL